MKNNHLLGRENILSIRTFFKCDLKRFAIEILTRCGQPLELYGTLDDYPVGDGDTLTVILVPDEATSPDEAAGDMEEVD